MKVIRNCLLLAATIIAALAGVSPAMAETAAAPVGTITESRVSGNGLNRVTLGPDNKLWFTECGATSAIGRIDPAQVGQQDPTVDHFPTPTPGSCPIDITTGPGGDLWFTEQGAVGANGAFKPTHPAPGKIGRITPNGLITEFPVPTRFARADGITAGPDGAVYLTESPGNNAFGAIGRAQAA